MEKTVELIELEEDVIDLIEEENPDEESIYEILDDIYILGYQDAVDDMTDELSELSDTASEV